MSETFAKSLFLHTASSYAKLSEHWLKYCYIAISKLSEQNKPPKAQTQ